MEFHYNSTIKQNNSYNPIEKIKFLPKFYNQRQTKTKNTWTCKEEVGGLKKKKKNRGLCGDKEGWRFRCPNNYLIKQMIKLS